MAQRHAGRPGHTGACLILLGKLDYCTAGIFALAVVAIVSPSPTLSPTLLPPPKAKAAIVLAVGEARSGYSQRPTAAAAERAHGCGVSGA